MLRIGVDVLGHASYFYVADVGAVEKAGEVDEHDDGNQEEVKFCEEFLLGFWIDGDLVDGVTIVQLFASLRQGQTVREWYLQNKNLLANVDMRRFITFGIIKGFLYRIHRYAVQLNCMNQPVQDQGLSAEGEEVRQPGKKHDKRQDIQLTEFLDGTHCFDEICTYYGISERDLLHQLDDPTLGEVAVICR